MDIQAIKGHLSPMVSASINSAIAKEKTPGIYLPYVDNEAYKITMDNFREHIGLKENLIEKRNEKLKTQNREIRQFLKVSPPDEIKTTFIKLFKDKYSALDPITYNAEAVKFNNTHGKYITYRLERFVESLTKEVFAAIIHIYQGDLRRKLTMFKAVGVTELSSMPNCKVNAHLIKKLQRKGFEPIKQCKATIRAHIEKLAALGVLKNKVYRGTKKPIEYTINPQILFYFEGKKKKPTSTENQPLTNSKTKSFKESIVSTCSLKKNLKKKDTEKPTASEIRNSTNLGASNANLLEHTICNVSKKIDTTQKSKPGGEKFLTETEKIKEFFKNKIYTDIHDFKESLTSGKYNEYHPISKKEIKALGNPKYLTKTEYLELLGQECIKFSASMWKDHNVFEGSWYKAIVNFFEQFGCKNDYGTLSYEHIYKKYKQMMWRIGRAKNWFTKNKFKNMRFPCQYFDNALQDHKSVCFSYTKNFWDKSQQQKQQRAEEKKENQRLGRIKKKRTTAEDKKYRALCSAIYREFNGDCTLANLLEYVNERDEFVRGIFAQTYKKLRANPKGQKMINSKNLNNGK